MTSDHSHSGSGCDDARHTLYSFLDGELTDDRRAAIQHHLEECSPCFEAFDFEAELLQVIGKKCVEEVPKGLADKIMSALRVDGIPPVTS